MASALVVEGGRVLAHGRVRVPRLGAAAGARGRLVALHPVQRAAHSTLLPPQRGRLLPFVLLGLARRTVRPQLFVDDLRDVPNRGGISIQNSARQETYRPTFPFPSFSGWTSFTVGWLRQYPCLSKLLPLKAALFSSSEAAEMPRLDGDLRLIFSSGSGAAGGTTRASSIFKSVCRHMLGGGKLF